MAGFDNRNRLEFDSSSTILDEWIQLRQEVYPLNEKLNIYEADLNLVYLTSK